MRSAGAPIDPVGLRGLIAAASIYSEAIFSLLCSSLIASVVLPLSLYNFITHPQLHDLLMNIFMFCVRLLLPASACLCQFRLLVSLISGNKAACLS